MKTSERILAYCAIIITLVAIAIWVKFARAELRPIPPPPLPPTIKTNHPVSRQSPVTTTTPAVEPPTIPSTTANETTTLPAPVAKPRRLVAPVKSPPRPPVAPKNYPPLTKVFAGGATVRGRAIFAGTAPRQAKLTMVADPQCAAMHGGQPVFTGDFIVNTNGTVRNVFVFIAEGIAGKYNPPFATVVLNQVGCLYEPHVFGMRAGQRLLIKNSDDTLHNIHALPNSNEEFNKGQPVGSADLLKTFLKPEIMVKFKCDVHPWMTAYVGVLEHPFFTVTGEDGSFAIGPLPAGQYAVAAWHEKYGVATQQVALAELEVKEIAFEYEPE